MKQFFLLSLLLITLSWAFAGDLVIIPVDKPAEIQQYSLIPGNTIHYISDDFIIATVDPIRSSKYILLEHDTWKQGYSYYVVSFFTATDKEYLSACAKSCTILYAGEKTSVISTHADHSLNPPQHGNIVRISEEGIKFPVVSILNGSDPKAIDPDIVAMLNNVDTVIYKQNLQQLQNFGTRNAYSSQGVVAQNWIKSKFESYGYSTQLFDFSMPGGAASDNVIATKTGTLYPDEYVVLGAHYDSYAGSVSSPAPGADDNGTGTAGILEAARIMAAYNFDRTILFCCWSGEEYGLYGSEAWASWADNQNLNILGYFNIDMCGYRHPGDAIHTDIIAPVSASPLKEFYKSVCSLYLPSFQTYDGALSGGDSDHTSFNDHGYMGIFPFEDSQNYSPYIHSSNDLIGNSVNSFAMCRMFTQATIASVATLANWLAPPQNLKGTPANNKIILSWDAISGSDHYNLYRDNVLVASQPGISFTDLNVVNNTTYTYYVTVVYSGTMEESNASNTVTITLRPPMTVPFTDNFESGATYWSFHGSWGLSTSQYYSSNHSMTESPSGNYANNLNISSSLYSFTLEDVTFAQVAFWTKYNLETNYDYTYLEISTNGNTWNTLATFNGAQSSWTQKTYSLAAYLGQPMVLLRFRFYSDGYVTKDGMYIDDFTITKYTDLDIKVFLQGPFSVNQMATALNSSNYLPLAQPFSGSPWNYSGTESVSSIPNADVVDWVLVEIRDASTPALAGSNTRVARQAGFLLKNGNIKALNGSSFLRFYSNIFDQMYVAVWHRNHLGVLSANPLNSYSGYLAYNYTSAGTQVFGNSYGHTELVPGIWGMTGGDGNGDGVISNTDKTLVWQVQAGQSGYLTGDFNMNGQVENLDKAGMWRPNVGRGTQVPQ